MTPKNMPIFFFSGTGNTWWVAQRIAEELQKNKIQATTHSIEQICQEEVIQRINQGDIIALGYPVYNSDAPLNMLSFIAALPKQEQKKPMLVFVTQAIWSGDGAYFVRKEVEARGFEIRWAVDFNMPNNISLDLGLVLNAFLSVLRAKPDNRRKRITKLVSRIIEDRSWIIGRSLFFSFGWTQRVLSRKYFHKLQFGSLQVDVERCASCERCMELCPVDNIEMVDGLPQFEDHCVFCQRCFNYCPELAIKAFDKPFKQGRFMDEPYQGPDPEFMPELLIKSP